MPYVIKYSNDSYNYAVGNGHETIDIDEAKRYATPKDAEEDRSTLDEIVELIEVPE